MIVFSRQIGVDFDRKFNRGLVGLSEEDASKAIKEQYLLSMPVEEIAERRLEVVRNLYPSQVKMFPGAKDLLSKLEQAGYHTALATSSPRDITDYALAMFDLRPYFDVVLTSADVKKAKPHPEIYTKAKSRLGANHERCLVIEDSVMGLEAATKAGLETIAIEHGGMFSRQELEKQQPLKVYKSIRSVRINRINKL